MIFGPKKNSSNNPSPLIMETSFRNQTELSKKDSFFETRHENQIFSHLKDYIIHRFIQKLKDNMKFKNFPTKNLNYLINLIGDPSYHIVEESSNFLHIIKRNITKIYQKMIISPDNPIRMVWNIFSIFYIGICFLYIPLEIAFEMGELANLIFDYLLILVFSFDIFINFLTADFIKGLLVIKPNIIFRNYLKSYFILDFLAFIYSFLELINESRYVANLFSIYKFLIIAKIPRFFSYLRIVSNFLKLDSKYQEVIDMMKLISYSLFMAHIFSCLWYMISNLDSEKNWIVARGIQEESLTTKYIYSLYWTIVTIMTVGYGDIVPQNTYEVLFSTFTIIFGCVLYAFNLNSIGIILQNHQKKENEFKNNMRVINNFMDRKNIDVQLQRRVQEYLNFMSSEHQSNNNEEEIEIINKLNETLKEELLLESYEGIFLNSPMFIKNFSEKSLRKMVKIIKEVKFFPGEEIFEEGIIDDCSLYFINSGSVEIYLNRTDSNSQNILKTCKKGETFGENSFFTQNHRDFSCRSLEFTSVLIINQEAALKIFKQNPEDYESYCMIKDKIILEHDFSLLYYRCFFCKSYSHTIKNCHHLHLVSNVEQILKKHEFYNEEPRRVFERKKYARFSHDRVFYDCVKFQDFQEKISINYTAYNTQISEKLFYNPPDTIELAENEEQISILKHSNTMKSESYADKNPEEENKEEKEEDNKEIKELHNLIADYEDLHKKKNKLNIPPKNISDCRSNTMHSKNSTQNKESKETNAVNFIPNENEAKKNLNTLCEETKIEQRDYDWNFEKLNNFQKYYPEMNCIKLINDMKFSRKINKKMLRIRHNLLPETKTNEDIFNKLQKLKRYSICIGKYKELIVRNLLKSCKINYYPKTHGNISECSPILNKKKRTFQGFFESKKCIQEKSIADLINSVIKQKKVINLKEIKGLQNNSKKNKTHKKSCNK